MPGSAQSVSLHREGPPAAKRPHNNNTNVSFFDPGNFNNSMPLPAYNVHIDNRQYNISNPNQQLKTGRPSEDQIQSSYHS